MDRVSETQIQVGKQLKKWKIIKLYNLAPQGLSLIIYRLTTEYNWVLFNVAMDM